MSRLNSIQERMESAVRRLEAALQNAPARGTAAPEDQMLATEIIGLRAERDRLQRELDSARADNANLARANTAVSGRLDLAIEELKTVLGN